MREVFQKVSLDKSEYELYGVIEHKGRSLSMGHYYSYVRNLGNLRDSEQ